MILPNFNNAKWLPRSLGAMLRQDLPPDEIIVVDDGSTDNSVEVIEAFQQRHDSIRLIRHPSNRGAPAALNTGLEAAQGEFVYFGAADDFIFPQFLSLAIDALTRHPQAAYFCGQVVLVEGTRVLGFRPFLQLNRTNAFIPPIEVCRLIASIDNWAVGQSVVFRRNTLQEIGGFDEALGSFCDGLVYRLLGCRDGFCVSDHLVAAWEVRVDSISVQTAMSQTQTPLIEKVQERLQRLLPADLSRFYPQLFERRLRFNMARVLLSSRDVTAKAVADLTKSPPIERHIFAMIGAKSRLSRIVILAWLTCRLRPFGLTALVRAWLNSARHGRARHAMAVRAIADAIEAAVDLNNESHSTVSSERGKERQS